ncbi:MAG: hypothetical protein A2W25_02855 [candidate division Zixibacteria bacterium RBG_16_53_22]|nr:MAG: hypothetical protein A2W25_02855 [candidate division Zixibacteria bacterium RBG_16_53_22]
MRRFLSFVLYLTLPVLLIDNPMSITPPSVGECTIGIFTGQATVDGRPILWKNRDVTNAIQKFCHYDPVIIGFDTTFAYLANCYSIDTTRVYMGINEAGFAIMNANSYNLGDQRQDGIDDGRIMRLALETCRTIFDFEAILDVTSVAGRVDCWNFGAIDAFGNAAMYEAANFGYAKYDANDSLNEGEGVVIRATFSLSGDNNRDGFPRYKRATQLVRNRLRTDRIDVEYVLQTLARDLANPIDDPYPLPYDGIQNGRPAGFILARDVTISRTISRSLIVIQGVAPGENPCLSTVWGMIGPPVLSVAFPMWVRSHTVPAVLNAGVQVPMFVQVTRRIGRLYPLRGDANYIDSRYLIGKDGVGLLTYTLALESGIIDAVEGYLTDWRLMLPGSATFASVQSALADSIYDSYLGIPLDFPNQAIADQPEIASISCYPNPFNSEASMALSGFGEGEWVDVGIYNMLGQLVYKVGVAASNEVRLRWNGRDADGNSLASGVYLVNAVSASRSATIKTILMK